MKKQVFILALVAMVCSGCTLARIFTYVPEPTTVTTVQVAAQPVVVQQPVATTTIYTQGSTKTVNVMSNATWDLSRYLDLNAVAAAFAQSATIRDFELLLNTSRYMLSNLDLNGDGYVDYILVLETQRVYTHVLLLQAVVGLRHGIYRGACVCADTAHLCALEQSSQLRGLFLSVRMEQFPDLLPSTSTGVYQPLPSLRRLVYAEPPLLP